MNRLSSLIISILFFCNLQSASASEETFRDYCEKTATDNSLREDRYTFQQLMRALNQEDCAVLAEILFEVDALDLSRARIVSVYPFSFLTRLKRLNLRSNAIHDITPLANLTGLESLDLSANNIEDITPIASLANLTMLDMSENYLSDISALESLEKIDELYVNENYLSDISFLSRMTSLHYIDLSKNPKIMNVSGICNARYLEKLDISTTNITNIDELAMCVNLKVLRAKGLNLRSLEAVRSLFLLNEINISDNFVSDVGFVVNLHNLEIFIARNNYINEVQPLKNLDTLQVVDLAHNLVSDQEALKFSGPLRSLILDGNPLAHFRSICLNRKLKKLSLAYTNLKTFDVLHDCQDLVELNVANNKISDMAGAVSFRDLVSLNINSNYLFEIPSAALLSKFDNLGILDIGQNYLSSLTGIESLRNLEVLDVSTNHVQTLPDINLLGRLRVLNISGNPIQKLSFKSDKIVHLALANTKIGGVLDLTTFTSLEVLELSQLSLDSVLGLDRMPHLTSLSLAGTKGDYVRGLMNQLSDLVGLEVLNLSNTGISSLSWIDEARHYGLRELDVSENSELSSVANISKLPALKLLNVSNAPLKVLDGVIEHRTLRSLSMNALKPILESQFSTIHLKHISMINFNLSSLWILGLLKHLETVRVDHNALNSVEDLRLSSRSLRELSVAYNQLESFDSLRGFSSLRVLSLERALRSDATGNISIISKLTALNSLNLSDNQLTEREAIEELPLLRELHINNLGLDNLDLLRQTSSLVVLYARSNSLSRIQSLASHRRLNKIVLDFNATLNDASAVSSLPVLKDLALQGTSLQKLGSEEGMYPALRRLYLSRAKESMDEVKTDLRGIEQLDNLEVLALNFNAPDDSLEFVEKLQGLRVLALAGSKAKSIEAVGNVRALRYVDLEQSSFIDPMPLSRLKHLNYLNLKGTVSKSCPVVEHDKKICHF